MITEILLIHHLFEHNFFSLNLDDSFCVLSNKFIIPLLFHYLSFLWRSCLSLCISISRPVLSCSFVTELFSGNVFETFVTLSAISFPIKSAVNYAVFWIGLFEAFSNTFWGSGLKCICSTLSGMINNVLIVFTA